jgi:hypothetical protein
VKSPTIAVSKDWVRRTSESVVPPVEAVPDPVPPTTNHLAAVVLYVKNSVAA